MDQVIRKGKGLVLVVNKWDLIDKNTHTMKETTDEIRRQFKSLDHYSVLYVSALNRQRIHKIFEVAWDIFTRGQNLLPTNKLNKELEAITKKNPPPAERGKMIRIKYAAQVSRQPAVIALYLNYPKLVNQSYKRYLENQLRLRFDLQGIPLKLSFRKK